jgi:thiol-disulfide isomerase/thioredoxin
MARSSTVGGLALGLILAIAWALFLIGFGPRSGSRGPDLGGATGADVSALSWPLLDLDGKPVDFARFRGKPTFLNIWATWCPPCLEEMPSIAALAKNPKLAGVQFVCVSTDESAEKLRTFVATRNWPMTILRAEAIPPVFLTDGIPATFLIGADGKVASSQVGSANWDEPEVVAFLEKLSRAAGH